MRSKTKTIIYFFVMQLMRGENPIGAYTNFMLIVPIL